MTLTDGIWLLTVSGGKVVRVVPPEGIAGASGSKREQSATEVLSAMDEVGY